MYCLASYEERFAPLVARDTKGGQPYELLEPSLPAASLASTHSAPVNAPARRQRAHASLAGDVARRAAA